MRLEESINLSGDDDDDGEELVETFTKEAVSTPRSRDRDTAMKIDIVFRPSAQTSTSSDSPAVFALDESNRSEERTEEKSPPVVRKISSGVRNVVVSSGASSPPRSSDRLVVDPIFNKKLYKYLCLDPEIERSFESWL